MARRTPPRRERRARWRDRVSGRARPAELPRPAFSPAAVHLRRVRLAVLERQGSPSSAAARKKSVFEEAAPAEAVTNPLSRSCRSGRLSPLRADRQDGLGGHCVQAQGFAVQGNGETFAALDQVKNATYSQAVGREELFERA